MKVSFTVDLPKEAASVMAAFIRRKARHLRPITVDFEDGTQRTLDGYNCWVDTTPKSPEPAQEKSPPEKKANSRTRRRDGEKRCCICEQWKPFSDFSHGGENRGGMSYLCRGCTSLYSSEKHRRNKTGESTKGLVAILRAQLAKGRSADE